MLRHKLKLGMRLCTYDPEYSMYIFGMTLRFIGKQIFLRINLARYQLDIGYMYFQEDEE